VVRSEAGTVLWLIINFSEVFFMKTKEEISAALYPLHEQMMSVDGIADRLNNTSGGC
jgi:hypothetical protein